MIISRSGLAKRASTWDDCRFEGPLPIARCFLAGRCERDEMEVGMLSGMFSDMAMERQSFVGMRRCRRETRVVSLWSRSLAVLIVQTRNGCIEVSEASSRVEMVKEKEAVI